MPDVVRSKYRELTDDERGAMQAVKDRGTEFLLTLDDLCPETRERSLAKTKIEEAVMWAVKGITG